MAALLKESVRAQASNALNWVRLTRLRSTMAPNISPKRRALAERFFASKPPSAEGAYTDLSRPSIYSRATVLTRRPHFLLSPCCTIIGRGRTGMTDYSRFENLNVTIDAAGVARVAINRPATLNAVTMEVHKDLEDVWLALDQDPSVKVVILTGEGRAFVAGGDLRRMAERLDTPEGREHLLSVTPKARRLLSSIVDFHKPLIAAVHGDAIGLGATLALFCDIIIIAEDARIGDPHVHVGVSAGDGGAVIWPLLVGPAKAKEFLMRGNLIKGVEAERINLVNHAVPT